MEKRNITVHRNEETYSWVSMPYVKGLTEKIKNVFNKENISIAS